MTDTQKGILAALILGGVCGIAGAALHAAWRARDERAQERVSTVVRQLERLADRMHDALTAPGATPNVPATDARGILVRLPASPAESWNPL